MSNTDDERPHEAEFDKELWVAYLSAPEPVPPDLQQRVDSLGEAQRKAIFESRAQVRKQQEQLEVDGQMATRYWNAPEPLPADLLEWFARQSPEMQTLHQEYRAQSQADATELDTAKAESAERDEKLEELLRRAEEERRALRSSAFGGMVKLVIVAGVIGLWFVICTGGAKRHADREPTAYEIQTGDYGNMARTGCNAAWDRLGATGGAGRFDENRFMSACNQRMQSVFKACAATAATTSDVLNCASLQYGTVAEAALTDAL